MCYKLRRQQNHNYGALCPGNLMKPVVSDAQDTSEPVPLQIAAQLSTTAVLSRLRLGLRYLALLLIAHVFMVMGQMLTLTSCSDLVKIVSLIAELVSVAELCFCWILAFRHTRTPPLPSAPSFPPILAQIICGHIHPAALLRRFNLFSPLLHRPSLPTTRPIHLLWGRPPLRVIKRCWRAVMLTNTLII